MDSYLPMTKKEEGCLLVDFSMGKNLDDLMLDEKVIYKLLYIDGIEKELIDRRDALTKDQAGDEQEMIEHIEAALSKNNKTACVCCIESRAEAQWLIDEKERIDRAMRKIPEECRKILEELCREKFTWRYLATQYQSNRKIKEMKDLALKETAKMIRRDTANAEKGDES